MPRTKLKVRVVHEYDPDPEAVMRAIAAIIRFSDERRALSGDDSLPSLGTLSRIDAEGISGAPVRNDALVTDERNERNGRDERD